MKMLCAALLFLTLIGCGVCYTDPHDVFLPPTVVALSSSEETTKAIRKLPVEERELLLRYVTRREMGRVFNHGDEGTTATTLGDAIDAQRELEAAQEIAEAEQEALAEKDRQERAALGDLIKKTVTVAVAEKGFMPANFMDGRIQAQITCRIVLQNKSDKTIRLVVGAILFNDLLGRPIHRISISYDARDIAPGGTNTWDAGVNYNQFEVDEVRFNNTDLDKMKVIWEPEAVVFSDGTQIGGAP